MAQSHPPSPVIVGDRVQQLDMLLHVQEFSSMVVLISGEPLIGKTQLLAAAEQQLSIHHQTISLTAQDVNSDEQLKLNLAQQLGCGASWTDLDNKLMAIKEQGDSLILLVDDAHLLNADLLTLLIAKSTTDQGWHLILAGDNQLRQQADAVEEQLQLSNLFHLIHLLPFTEDESDQFVQAFFKVQGQEALPISQKAMHQLWLLSKGNTGRLVELLDSQLEKQQAKSAQFPMAHVAAVLLIGCALLFSYLYQEDPVTADDPIAELLAQQPDSLAKLSDTKPSILMRPEASLIPSDPVKDEPKPAPLPSVVSEVATVTPKPVPKQEKPVELEIKQGVQTQSVVIQQPAKRAPSHPLLDAPEQSFVLQLVGVRNEKSAQAMAKKLSGELNTDKVSFYETTYKNAPWFVVVYGPVTDKQKAKSTAQSLSKSLKSNPWIRPIAKIQEDIRKKQP